MSDPKIRIVGTMSDMDDMPLSIGVDHDTVTLTGYLPVRLTAGQAEEFASLFVAACWEAAGQRALMAEEDRA